MGSRAKRAEQATVGEQDPPAYEETEAYLSGSNNLNYPSPADPMMRQAAGGYYDDDEDSDDDCDASKYQQGVGNPLQSHSTGPTYHQAQVHHSYQQPVAEHMQEQQPSQQNQYRQYPTAASSQSQSRRPTQPRQHDPYSSTSHNQATAAYSNYDAPRQNRQPTQHDQYSSPPRPYYDQQAQDSHQSHHYQQPTYSRPQTAQRPANYIPPRPTVSNGPYYKDGISDYSMPSPYFTEHGKLKPYENPKRLPTANPDEAASQQPTSPPYVQTGASQPYIQAGATGTVYDNAQHAALAQQYGFNERANDYMCCSIFNCLCCCMITGLIAIVFSHMVQHANSTGDYKTARKYSLAALITNVLSPIVAIVTVVILLVTGTSAYLYT